jgi:hypothetical protein
MMAAEAIDGEDDRLSGLDALRLTLFSGVRIVEEYMQDEIEENDLDADDKIGLSTLTTLPRGIAGCTDIRIAAY